MAKKIALLVRERQGEALRVAVGLTLCDDTVEVYVLDRPVAATEDNAANLEVLKELGVSVVTNTRAGAGLEHVVTEEIARRVLSCDHLLAY